MEHIGQALKKLNLGSMPIYPSDPCEKCGNSGYIEVVQNGAHTYTECDCALGQFQREKSLTESREWASQRIKHLYIVANIPKRYGLADLWDVQPENVMQYRAAINKGGLFIWGAIGTGKTYLAAALLNEFIDERGKDFVDDIDGGWRPCKGMFCQVPDLLDQIREGYSNNMLGQNDLLGDVKQADLLVLDDIGAEKVTDWVREKLFQIVNARYNSQKKTIITSNMSPDELAGHIGDRTVSRIVEMCQVVKLEGKDRRLG